MKRDDWMLFSLTFLTGFAIGMYVYVTVFKPVYQPDKIDNNEQSANDWSVTGKKRGNNPDPEYVQPSFRLLSDRSYVYLAGSRSDKALVPEEGKISRSLRETLAFNESSLVRYSESVRPSACASASGGIDYEYRFTVSGHTYLLDTCYTRLSEDVEAMKTLQRIWTEIEGGPNNQPNLTPAKWLERWLQQRLGTDVE